MAVSDSEMNRMQQDAIRRVREMQARAMQYQSGGQPESRRSDTHAQQRQTAPSARNAPAERREMPGAQGQHAPQNTAAHADCSQHPQQSAHASPGAFVLRPGSRGLQPAAGAAAQGTAGGFRPASSRAARQSRDGHLPDALPGQRPDIAPRADPDPQRGKVRSRPAVRPAVYRAVTCIAKTIKNHG